MHSVSAHSDPSLARLIEVAQRATESGVEAGVEAGRPGAVPGAVNQAGFPDRVSE